MARVARLGHSQPTDQSERATLLDQLVRKVDNSRTVPARSRRTRRTSTPSPSRQQPAYPGDRDIEHRIRAIIRWNAMAMVVRANRTLRGAGRPHLDLCVVGLPLRSGLRTTSFARGKTMHPGRPRLLPGARVSGHLFARLPGRDASMPSPRLHRFRREVDGSGPLLLPAPVAHAGLLGVPDRLHGAVARSPPSTRRASTDTLRDRGICDTDNTRACGRSSATARRTSRKHSALIGTLASREHLDNLNWVINCNLQRLDGPVRGNGKIIQELEAIFRGAGWSVIKVIWGDDWDPLLAQDRKWPTGQTHGGSSRRAVPEIQRLVGRLHSPGLLRGLSGDTRPGPRFDRRQAREDAPRRPR